MSANAKNRSAIFSVCAHKKKLCWLVKVAEGILGRPFSFCATFA
jgi:hypothetical protein